MMKRWLFAAAAMLCACTALAVPVAPATIPRITFVNGAGLPCAGCKLYTYAAGTTTPLASYTDSTGTSQNTNPIVLDAAGGANIWLGSNSYKFALKSAAGSTIWTVDSINAGSLFPCGSPTAVQIANTSALGLACDANITINTTSHTLSIGSLGAHYVSIGALGTPTSWTFDTTSPTTALASLGGGVVAVGAINQIAIYPAAGNAVAGSGAIPNGIVATTQGPSDNTGKVATTAYVAHPGSIAPTDVTVGSGVPLTGNQGTGVLVQHSTGSTTAGHGAAFDAGGNVVDAGSPYPSGTPITCNTSGCYQIDGDGTIRQWGVAPGISGGGVESVSFPTNFTSTAHMTVITSVGGGGGNVVTKATSITTAGFTAGIAGVVFVGGSGGSPTGGETIQWFAVGN